MNVSVRDAVTVEKLGEKSVSDKKQEKEKLKV